MSNYEILDLQDMYLDFEDEDFGGEYPLKVVIPEKKVKPIRIPLKSQYKKTVKIYLPQRVVDGSLSPVPWIGIGPNPNEKEKEEPVIARIQEEPVSKKVKRNLNKRKKQKEKRAATHEDN